MAGGRFAQGEEFKAWSRRIQDIMDEMRNRSFCDYRTERTWRPRVNIYATRRAYHVCVDLSGVDTSSLSVECPDRNRVCLSGQRDGPHLAVLVDAFSVELLEIDEGPFLREIEFTEAIIPEQLEFKCERGQLWISLPKVEPA